MIRVIERPQMDEYDPYYEKYISKVNGDPIATMHDQLRIYTDYIKVNRDRLNYRYAEGKWSIKESMIHIIDTEQIFAYRALRISRGDQANLCGFDQDEFIKNTNYDHIDAYDLLEEFTNQRRATISMFDRFSEDQWLMKGRASDGPVSTRALVFMIPGHAEHHLQLFKERYQ